MGPKLGCEREWCSIAQHVCLLKGTFGSDMSIYFPVDSIAACLGFGVINFTYNNTVRDCDINLAGVTEIVRYMPWRFIFDHRTGIVGSTQYLPDVKFMRLGKRLRRSSRQQALVVYSGLLLPTGKEAMAWRLITVDARTLSDWGRKMPKDMYAICRVGYVLAS